VLQSDEIASSMTLLAMTGEGCHCHFFIVIASEAWQSQKSKTQKSKGKMREMFKNVVRGFSLVHDPEGSHYKRGVPSMTPYCHCERSVAIPAG